MKAIFDTLDIIYFVFKCIFFSQKRRAIFFFNGILNYYLLQMENMQ